MSKIILTSDGIDSKEVYDLFDGCVNCNSKVAIITTAKDEKEKAKGPIKSKKLFFAMGAKVVDFIDIEFDNPNNLLKYDLIYLDGGSPFRLMHWIRKTKSEIIFKQLIKNNKIVAGRSAGSMVLGNNFSICNYLTPEMNIQKMTDFTGMGLCDINICPHYNNFPSIYENCEEKLKKCEQDNNITITKLFDGQAIVIDNSTIKKIAGPVLEI